MPKIYALFSQICFARIVLLDLDRNSACFVFVPSYLAIWPKTTVLSFLIRFGHEVFT